MRWKDRRRSTNVEDRRGNGRGGFGGLFGGRTSGGRQVRSGRKGMGMGTLILMALVALIFGKDLSSIFGVLGGGSPGIGQTQQSYPQRSTSPNANGQYANSEDEIADFVKVILGETEETWSNVFQRMGKSYRAPKLVIYSGVVRSACGTSSSSSGPFYCPGDEKIYIDLSFLSEMRQMGASGDFAFAYVIAHEVGHHVQKLVGVADEVRRNQRSTSKVRSNAIQVRMELQADCLAGVWTNNTEKRRAILEPGDIQEGMNAAAAVGDDRISKGRLARHNYTHGSSQERMQWFQNGLRSGDVAKCNTFENF